MTLAVFMLDLRGAGTVWGGNQSLSLTGCHGRLHPCTMTGRRHNIHGGSFEQMFSGGGDDFVSFAITWYMV